MDGDKTIPGHGQQTSLLPSAAFDITVASPLKSINMFEAGMYQGVSAKAAEHRKHTENDLKCVELMYYRLQWRAMGPGDQRH